jgi:hypothetical protein
MTEQTTAVFCPFNKSDNGGGCLAAVTDTPSFVSGSANPFFARPPPFRDFACANVSGGPGTDPLVCPAMANVVPVRLVGTATDGASAVWQVCVGDGMCRLAAGGHRCGCNVALRVTENVADIEAFRRRARLAWLAGVEGIAPPCFDAWTAGGRGYLLRGMTSRTGEGVSAHKTAQLFTNARRAMQRHRPAHTELSERERAPRNIGYDPRTGRAYLLDPDADA